jgi:AraC-like DNA-binding protein
VEGADPERLQDALGRAYGKDDPDMLQQVYRTLRSVLLNGKSSGNEVADALSMHRRTLNRRLQECGTTFQQVLDETRCEAARQLLCYSKVALDDIAASLAYAGVSPFMRSFRRWTGLTPGRLRRLGLAGPHHVRALTGDGRGTGLVLDLPTRPVGRDKGIGASMRRATEASERPHAIAAEPSRGPRKHSGAVRQSLGLPMHSAFPVRTGTHD